MTWIRLAIYAAIAAAVTAGVLAVRSHWIGLGEANVQAHWDAQQRLDQAESLRLQQEASREQFARVRNAERNADEQARREATTANRIAALNQRVGRLLDTVATLNGRDLPAPTDAAGVAALARQAAAARQLLGACAGRYSDVAAAADQLRDQVIGLQADAATVCRGGSAAIQPTTPSSE